jgi:hypothetical protein
MWRKANRRAAAEKIVRKIEAGAIAFVVAQTIGLSTGRVSANYNHLYHGNAALLAESLEVIQRTSRAYTRCNREAKMEIPVATGNDHEPWTNLGSSSDDARRSIAAHCSGRQASLRLLHGAPACHHGWRSLLGVESVQGRPASLDMDVCRGCASFEPVLADTYAADTVATD